MAALATAVRTARAIQNITKLLTNASLSTSPAIKITSFSALSRPCFKETTVGFHTTTRQSSLMEFFDDKKNWGTNRIKVGRSWRKDELRIKSNEDLHKLWYILLKEKNMLMTMEHEYAGEFEYFPNPERIDKVEESMSNLEDVVRERNRAYYELETGEHGERPTKYVRNQLGLPFRYKMIQHIIPKFMNNKWKKTHIHSFGGYAVAKFLRLLREQRWNWKRKTLGRETNQVKTILRRFPNVDINAVKAKYPNVNIEKLKDHKRTRGHFLPRESYN